MNIEEDKKYVRMAIALSRQGMESGSGGPFGAVIVKGGSIIGQGYNQVTSTNDPTAHAEVVAIRDACKTLGSFQLEDCTLYSSCEPCPMCLGAIYWARPARLVYACSADDAAAIGFDDSFIYEEIALKKDERNLPSRQLLAEEGREVMELWQQRENKIRY